MTTIKDEFDSFYEVVDSMIESQRLAKIQAEHEVETLKAECAVAKQELALLRQRIRDIAWGDPDPYGYHKLSMQTRLEAMLQFLKDGA